MTVLDAKRHVQRWVSATYAATTGFMGAYLGGSIGFMNDEAAMPAGSDIDVRVVLESKTLLPERIRDHVLYEDLLIEPMYVAADDVLDSELVLGSPYTASDIFNGGVISDPSGRLAGVVDRLSREYSNERHVRRRCRGVGDVIDGFAEMIRSPDVRIGTAAAVFSVIVMGLAQVLLVASLRNPTLRASLVHARSILEDWNRIDIYQELLSLTGADGLDDEVIKVQAARFLKAFDYATTVVQTNFPVVDQIDPMLRERWADGIQELIQSGNAPEASPFILTMHGASMVAIENDAPEAVQASWLEDFDRTLAELGLIDQDGIRRRTDQAQDLYRRILALADDHIATDPSIGRD